MSDKIVPIFFALDERFLKYGIVSLYSLRENAKSDCTYRIYFLHTDVKPESQAKVKTLESPGFEINFENVSSYLEDLAGKFPLRDYYSKTTYFRLFIADMHPEYYKAIYIDSDTIIQGDMSDLYDIDITGFILGACHEQAMVQVDEYGRYVEKCLGLDRNLYFNAGLLLINCNAFRERNVLERFIQILQVYDCVVTQDEDYLNLLCKDHVKFIDQRWNTEIFGTIPYPIEEAKMLHYIMFNKPWHYETCPHADIFYAYAKKTWGTDETMASPSNTKYPYNAATKYIYEWATTNSNVKAIFAGHFHFSYEGYTGRTPIYLTGSGYSGTMRHIVVKPTSCAVHTWDEGEVITEPGARPGSLYHTCTVCGDSEYVEIPAICSFGDVNANDGVDMADILMVRRHIARAANLTARAELLAADVNEDGAVNAKDVLLMRKFIAGIIPSLGGE